MGEGRALRWALLGGALLALILVPFFVWERELNVWSERFLGDSDARGVIAVAVALLLTLDVLLPIPS